ncbi:Ig-like domain-containing protein [Nocardioides marmoriginsengisoli]|uniref:Ig-like domain-containing protein n=1 Tax=Nocardioides marmoriginsengisoli TaxID=661483 RepID=UPI001C835C41|nr:Ig-like domain-containing protein [Nocardioides marmoriginsengisoli]
MAAFLIPGLTPVAAIATPEAADTALPDPMARGSYTPVTVQETKLGLAALQEPNSSGAAPTAGTAQAAENLQIRGQLFYPGDRAEPSPLIVLVHGNHGSCDSGQDSANVTCAAFKRNEAGYAYLGENLATWGYTTFSLSQDQLMMRQDGNKGKGMHQRRKLIAAALDALSAANAPGGLAVDANTTIGTTLVGKLDLTRIGLMGHSRGGDAVTSFIDYNRLRTDGPRYPLRGVISLAPVDYERKAPYGTPYMTILPFCDGDVSNLQGARFYERSQYINPNDPFPRIQSSQLGAIHNWYNTVWYADGGADGQSNNDAACGNSAPFAATNVHPNNLRLSGAASYTDDAKNYKIDNSDTFNPLVNTKISGDPARMGDQEKIGLATMSAFFRRYVGGEGAFEPYLTGELSDTASHLQIPETACPTSTSGTRIACKEYVSTSYFPAKGERVDVIRPEVQNPLGLNALGGTLSGSGFAYPYLDNGAVSLPKKTAGGYDWCNPEPDDFAPAQLGKSSQPTGAKACPLPAKAALGGQNAVRENAPVNHSYGRQLALAWEADKDAELTADIPAASKDVSGLKALSMGADVNFFDLRNPGADNRGDNTRTGTSPDFVWPNELPTSYDPASTTQDFIIALKDTKGNEGIVHAGDERWGNALHMSTGTNTPNTHIVLDQIRVPLSEFATQGVDLTSLDKLTLRFGAEGTPQTGSIQLADVRFQEAAVADPLVLSDGNQADGAGSGPPSTGPDPADLLESYDVSAGKVALIDAVADKYSNTSWLVDDDKAQCPTANFTSIQEAVDYAAPWDTIVVCAGTYEESSTPVFHASNPVATGATNGLTITKPLKIKGAGADKVTIEPDQSLDTLAGVKPYLRDGGGNVITVSRQSLGSTDTNEMFVDISGVTVTAGSTYAEAGIAFFGAAGRVSESVVGPMKVAGSAAELAENPHGWGIVKTGMILGAGAGTVENEVTVANSVVTGYQSGGILFDGARGADGSADNVVRTNVKQHGYVTGTVVRGKPNSVYPQAGIKYASGADGFVKGSRITGNYFKPDPSKSYGLLLADAGIEAPGSLTASGNIVTGNGFAAFNANADNTAVRQGAPFALTGSFLGQGNPVAGGPADPNAGTEAISGPDSTPAATVTTAGRLSSPPAGVPTGVGAVEDESPSAALIDPGTGLTLKVGETVFPFVSGHDDFAVKAASLLVDGASVGTSTEAPYGFSWTPAAADAGKTVTLTAVVTDSSGQATTSDGLTIKVAKPSVPPIAPKVTLGKVVKNTKAGTATIAVTVNTPGTITLAGGRVVPVTVKAKGATTVKVPLKAKVAYRKSLTKRHKLVVPFKVTFKGANGGTVTATRTVTLIKKR